MKTITTLLLLPLLVVSTGLFAQVNDNCASATTIVSGAAALCSQTTNNAGVQSGEYVSTCASATFNETVWYRFRATTTNMFIELQITGAPSCDTRMGVVLYNTDACTPGSGNVLQCKEYDGDGAIVLYQTGLTVGNYYKIQVGYRTTLLGLLCPTSPTFCIKTGNTPANCTCSLPCSAGCGYTTTPTVAQVLANCPVYTLSPVSDGGTADNYCYTFTAKSTTVSFNMIISSTCTGGNVSSFTWTLQKVSCGANVASGTLSSLSVSSLTIGTQYVLCYNYTIPVGCYHSAVYPYFIGASPLPVELNSFTGKAAEMGNILQWGTQTEHGTDYFTIEKSTDGIDWASVGKVNGNGDSFSPTAYQLTDQNVDNAINYYRLIQTDVNGKRVGSGDIVSIDNRGAQTVETITYYDLNGREVSIDADLTGGIYLRKTTLSNGTSEVTKIYR